MADLQPLLPRKISQSIFPPVSDAPPIVDLPAPSVGSNPLGSIAPAPLTPVTNPDAQRIDSLKADIARRENPTKPTTTLGKIGHVAANIGNVLGDIFAPSAMSLIPGTQLGNERMVGIDQGKIKDISDRETEATSRANTAATTNYTEQRPDIERGKIMQHLTTALTPKGYSVTENTLSPSGFDIVEDPNSQGYKDRVSLSEMHDATAEKEAIQSDIAKNHYIPGTPEYAEAQRKLSQVDQRLGVAMAGLGLRRESLNLTRDNYLANNLGVDDQGNPLPGSMITDSGQTVGSKFSTNVRPTMTERKTGDLAQSAVNQVHTMRSIVQAHPEIFGPAAGRTTSAEAWLGSQSPDAQKFLSASRYLADHSAGVFGSRSVEITKSLEQLTDPHSNPDALNAALDTAESTAQHFVKAGKVRTTGSDANSGGSSKVKKYNPATGRLE
jgi:hypothetical protein